MGSLLALDLGTITAFAPNPSGTDDPHSNRGAVSHYVPAYYLRSLSAQQYCTRVILGRSAWQNPILGFTIGVLYDSLRVLCRLDSISMEVCTTYK